MQVDYLGRNLNQPVWQAKKVIALVESLPVLTIYRWWHFPVLHALEQIDLKAYEP